MSETSFEDYKPLEIRLKPLDGGEDLVAALTPNGEQAKLQILSDIDHFSAKALQNIVTGLLETIRENAINYKLYYKVPTSDESLARALTGNGFEKHESTDTFDYYSPIGDMDHEQVASLSAVNFVPELAESIERILSNKTSREGHSQVEFKLRYTDDSEFESFTVLAEMYNDGSWPVYQLTIKSIGRSESVYKTRKPTEVIELHIDPNTGKILSYNKKIQYLDEKDQEVILPQVGNSPFILEVDAQMEHMHIIDPKVAQDWLKHLDPRLSLDQYEEITKYMEKVLVEYSIT